MVDFVAEFLRDLSNEEVEPASLMLLGYSFNVGESKMLDLSWATISDLIKRLVDVDWSIFSEFFAKTGDLGSTVKSLFEKNRFRRQITLVQEPLTILEVRRIFEAIAKTGGSGSRERKERLLETLLGDSSALEAKYIVKILIGKMRTGFHEGLLELAVSKAFDVPQDIVRKANMILGNIGEVAKVTKTEGIDGLLNLKLQVFRPIKPMLAQTAVDVNAALGQHGGRTAFEYKLDGARVQIHLSGGVVRIFSRRLKDVTESFPEIAQLILSQVHADKAILEGEIIAVGEYGNPVPFQHLMRRFRRVLEVETMIEKVPVQLQLFDLLYVDGISFIDKPYVSRRDQLGKIVGKISLVKQKIISDQTEAETFLKEAVDGGHEGLMAKKLVSLYTPGIRGKCWFKIKVSLEPLDLVIVAAE